MPSTAEHPQANCPECQTRLELNPGMKIPWHKRRYANGTLAQCSAIGQTCVPDKSESQPAKKKR